MKNNALIIILVILVGLLSGIALLLGIGSMFHLAFAPVNARLAHVEAQEKLILQQIQNPDTGAAGPITVRQLAAIQNQLRAIQAKVAGGMPPAFNPPQPPAEDFNKVYNIPLANSPIKGKKDAPITIIDFADLQCPFCARFYPPLNEVLKAYPDKVKVILKNFPLSFHPNARPAAKLALAANEQGKYYEMAELLLQNGGDVSEAKVKDYAKQLGLNYDKLMADVKTNDAAYEKRIADDAALGEKSDVQGTPTFFINGKKTMARSFDQYKAQIDKILAGK